jgi:hypothetical protein
VAAAGVRVAKPPPSEAEGRAKQNEAGRSTHSVDTLQPQSRGAEGTRTPDPHTASVVRYQLRHSPLHCPAWPGTEEILHTPGRLPGHPPQLREGSGGKCATAARMSPWRRRTMAHRSSGRLMNGSPGRASKTNQEPEAISTSSWPADRGGCGPGRSRTPVGPGRLRRGPRGRRRVRPIGRGRR